MSTETDHDEPANENPSRGELEILLQDLRAEHRRIDKDIKQVIESGVFDIMKVKRMKKIKLSLKDQIVMMENQLTPDIIA